jgi:glycosyltransferase involved in cell wall biosynthesis
MTPKKPKILYFVTVDWFFCSHFMDRALAAREAGYEVCVLTSAGLHREAIEKAGLRLIPLDIDRRSLNPVGALHTLWQLVRVLRRERPDVLHQVALKPILLGGIAARITGVKRVVNALVGGGYLFTSEATLMRGLRPLVHLALRFLLNPPGSRVIFENQDDLTAFVSERQVRAQDAVLIRGAGVNVERFNPGASRHTEPLVVVPARLLWDKGLGEFVAAARLLKQQGTSARFALVGDVDPGNRASIDNAVLEDWRAEGVVELWGFRLDMPRVLAEADIVCLPSYREGLPKALLEGMAASLPCVTTDVPGCREAVRDGDNGSLVPPRDHVALAHALKRLIEDADLRHQMGQRGRIRVMAEFASPIICRQTLQVYEEMLAS